MTPPPQAQGDGWTFPPSSFHKPFRATQKAGMLLVTRPTSVAVVFLWDEAILDPCIVDPCIVNSISQDVYNGNRKRNKSGKLNFYPFILTFSQHLPCVKQNEYDSLSL